MSPDLSLRLPHPERDSCFAVWSRGKFSNVVFEAHFPDYPQLPTIPGICISSPKEVSAGRFWWLDVYPGGLNGESHHDFVACYVRLESHTATILAYSITLIYPMQENPGRSVVHSFRLIEDCLASRRALGSHAIVKRNELLRNYCHDNTVTFRVEIAVFEGIEHTSCSEQAIQPRLTGDPRNFRPHPGPLPRLLFNADFADVVLKVGSEKIPAHQCIICSRSDMFRAMFALPMKERASREAEVVGFSEAAVRELLRFLYTDACLPSALTDDMESLLSIACMYQVAEMKTYLEERCLEDAALPAATLLRWADAFDCQHLRASALQSISSSLPRALQQQELTEQLTLEHCLHLLRLVAQTSPAT